MKHLKELLIESIADLKDLLVEYLTSENLSVKEVAQLLNPACCILVPKNQYANFLKIVK